MFPLCSDEKDLALNKAPCKRSCDEFSRRCPGADVSCDALTDDANLCYTFDYTAESGVLQTGGLRGWPSLIICLLVLGAMVGFAQISKVLSPKDTFQPMGINSAGNVA